VGGAGRSELRLAEQLVAEQHIVEADSGRGRVAAAVGRHAAQAVLGLVGRQLAPQLVGRDVRLSSVSQLNQHLQNHQSNKRDLPGRQYSERFNDLLGAVCVQRFSRHEVKEGVEANAIRSVRIHKGNDSLELDFALKHLL